MTHLPNRCAVNARFLTQAQSGVQRYAFNLLSALDQKLGQGALVEAIGPVTAYYPAGARLQIRPDWRHIRLMPLSSPWPFAGHLWEQITLPRACKGAYLLNLTGSGPLSHAEQLLVIHDANVWKLPEAFSRRYRTFHKTVRPCLARRARDLGTVSQFSASELAEVLAQPELRFRVIPNGSDHLPPPENTAKVMRDLGLTKNGFFLAVGNLSPNKNLARLIAAMAEAGHPVPLVVAGASAAGLATDTGPKGPCPPEHVRFLGRIDDATLAALYAGARAFIWPPLREGFGIPPLEAMRFGTPVLSSNTTAMPEVLEHAPLYFNPEDSGAIAQTITRFLRLSAKARDAMVMEGHNRACRFTWEASGAALADLLVKRVAA
ncbi:glycosyltransferase family 1 protein [Thioclava sp. GXIMD2076]|uniref:glycosyltransferase family 4 protein n=1 Tax=Thioclava sp. GXIMD2076 TaxID=3131931 RepID=UPI0030CA5D25